MGDFIVRLSSLTLENIKNVKKGTIFMPMVMTNRIVLAEQRFLVSMGRTVQEKRP